MKVFSTVYSTGPFVGLVTGLVLSSASVAVAGPISNASFETGPLGQNSVLVNDWAYSASTGSLGITVNTLSGPGWSYTRTDGSVFSRMSAVASGSIFLQSAAFTVVNPSATIQFDYWFEGAAAVSVGSFTQMLAGGGGGTTNFAWPNPTVSSGGTWQTLAPVVIPQGEWILTFGLINFNSTSAHMGLDNIRVVDNPVIPLPTGAVMAMVGMGAISLRRRRS